MKYKAKITNALRISEMSSIIRWRGLIKKLTCPTEDMETRFPHHTGDRLVPRQKTRAGKKLAQSLKMTPLLIV